jgi:cysteine desulfurase
LESVICGGEQENGMRGGTNNAPTNIVFAKTLRKALEAQKSSYDSAKKLNDY